MTENPFDRVSVKIEQRLLSAMGKVDKIFAKSRPFDTPAITPRKQLEWYLTNFTPEFETDLRQTEGDGVVNDYILKMHELAREDANA